MTREELERQIRFAESDLATMLKIKEDCGKNRYADKLVEQSKRRLYYLKKKLEKTK